MDYVKQMIWGPDQKEQIRSCQALVRKNRRQLDRSIGNLNPLQKKTESLIKSAAKKDDMKAARLYARELVNIQKQKQRLYNSKATIDSIGLQINEQAQMVKLQGNLRESTGIMREVNSLVRLPEISHSAQELSKELMKSGIINEMVEDTMEEIGEEDDLEDEEEIEAIVKKYTEKEVEPQANEPEPAPQEEEEEDNEEILDEMRQRLKALQY